MWSGGILELIQVHGKFYSNVRKWAYFWISTFIYIIIYTCIFIHNIQNIHRFIAGAVLSEYFIHRPMKGKFAFRQSTFRINEASFSPATFSSSIGAPVFYFRKCIAFCWIVFNPLGNIATYYNKFFFLLFVVFVFSSGELHCLPLSFEMVFSIFAMVW